MKKIIRPLLALFFFWTLFGWTFGQPVLANDYETLNASIMRPDPVTLMDWIQKSKEAPKTVIDEEIQRKVLQTMSAGLGASDSLLDHISYVPAERNQGNCGNCWNWAGTGVMEVALDVARCCPKPSFHPVSQFLQDRPIRLLRRLVVHLCQLVCPASTKESGSLVQYQRFLC